MRSSPFDVGPIHFVGIGGIGMSGIAEVMLNLGYTVQGSDIKANANVTRLEALGARVMIGHATENVEGAAALVVSTAIKPGNPELIAARAQKIPVVRRAEMLAELMRLKHAVAVAGTHGKTTTTSLVAALLDAAGVDPTVINGGVIHAYGSNAKMGGSDWMVVEADESDGSFLKLRGTIAIVTNIDPEHLDHYGRFDALRAAFDQFVAAIPFYGAAICCLDHPEVQALVARTTDRRVVTYGFNQHADIRAVDVVSDASGARFDVVIARRGEPARTIKDVRLPMAGRHNVLNTLAAIGAVLEFAVTDDQIRQALAAFGGVKRRFTTVGGWNGARIVDDYGHHPVEIAAVLRAAREVTNGKVIAVVQPHRYTRLRDLFEDFCTCMNDADSVLVADVYPAGEDLIVGATSADLVAGLINHGHRDARPISREALAATLRPMAGPGDLIVCLGAGDITAWAGALEAELGALS